MSSKIYYMELNPILECSPKYYQERDYPLPQGYDILFTRNRMKVYDKNGTQVDPHSIKWAKYAGKGVPYTVKQDNKAGNSLGAYYFPFPEPLFRLSA